MEWLPIETAPKDGTLVDLWASDKQWPDCSWTGMYWFSPDIYDCGAEMELHGHFPKYWMPLPKPPTSNK